MRAKGKVETVDEYLSRGGAVTKLPHGPRESIKEVLRQTPGGPAVILTYEEADLFYGESKPRKHTKSTTKIDLSALPENLRKKFMDRYGKGDEKNGET